MTRRWDAVPRLYPAAHIIDKCGGYANVRAWLELTPAQVYKFAYPKERGGTGGAIPHWHHRKLIDEAAKRGIHITPDDFFVSGPMVVAQPEGPPYLHWFDGEASS